MIENAPIAVGLLGLGIVGGGVAAVLAEKAETLARQVGRPLELRRVLVRDLHRPREAAVAPALLTTDPQDVLADPAIAIVIEVPRSSSTDGKTGAAATEKYRFVITLPAGNNVPSGGM